MQSKCVCEWVWIWNEKKAYHTDTHTHTQLTYLSHQRIDHQNHLWTIATTKLKEKTITNYNYLHQTHTSAHIHTHRQNIIGIGNCHIVNGETATTTKKHDWNFILFIHYQFQSLERKREREWRKKFSILVFFSFHTSQ